MEFFVACCKVGANSYSIRSLYAFVIDRLYNHFIYDVSYEVSYILTPLLISYMVDVS